MATELSNVWDRFTGVINEGLPQLVEGLLKGGLDQARLDVKDFLEDSGRKLKLWGDALAQGKIDRDDFEFLVKQRADLLEMHHLRQIGTRQNRLENFRRGFISLVITSAFSAIGL